MSFGKGRGGLDRQIICLKYLIFFTNVVCWLLGAALFALATWIRFQDDFQEWVTDLGLQHYWTGTWILFSGGLLMMIFAFVGCCATIAESQGMLITAVLAEGVLYSAFQFIALTSTCFVINLAGAAYTLDHGIEYAKLTPWLKNRLYDLVTTYERDPKSRRIMNMIQEYIGCCGSRGSGDYDDLGLPIPDECRDHVTGNEFSDGCMEVFAWYLETKTGWVAGSALFLCLFQLITIAFAVCLCNTLRQEKRRGSHRTEPYY